MGHKVGMTVQERFGKSVMELGGNNGTVVDENANLDLVLRSLLCGCFMTNGQCCTSTRRLVGVAYMRMLLSLKYRLFMKRFMMNWLIN